MGRRSLAGLQRGPGGGRAPHTGPASGGTHLSLFYLSSVPVVHGYGRRVGAVAVVLDKFIVHQQDWRAHTGGGWLIDDLSEVQSSWSPGLVLKHQLSRHACGRPA